MAYTFSNIPSQLSLDKMFGSLNANKSVTKGCRFIVKINLQGLLLNLSYSASIQPDLIYAADAAEFPGRGFNVSEARYYGPRQLTPNNTIYGDGINISFICRSKSLERRLFDDWMDIINPITTFHFKYPKDYYADIDIFHYAEYADGNNSSSPSLLYGWKLLNAWPTLVTPQQVSWADSDILRLQVTFAYKRWVRATDTENIASRLTTQTPANPSPNFLGTQTPATGSPAFD